MNSEVPNNPAEQYKETIDTWDKLATVYEARFMHLDIYNASYDYFCEALGNEHATVLEIGCGPGNISHYLLSQHPNYQITGIDSGPSMIELAQKNNPQATFKVMDARELATLNACFNGIVCGFCIPYLSFSDCQKLIQDGRKLLSTNGILYISFVEGEASQSGYQTGSSGHRIYFHYHNQTQLQKTLMENDFSLIKVFKIDYRKSDGSAEVHTVIMAKLNS